MAVSPLRANPLTIDQVAERKRLADEARERSLPLADVNPDPNLQAVEQAARDQTPEELAQRTQDFDLRVAQGQDKSDRRKQAIVNAIATFVSRGRATPHLKQAQPRAVAELMQRRQAGDKQAARAFNTWQQAQAKVKAGREAEEYKQRLGSIENKRTLYNQIAKEANLPESGAWDPNDKEHAPLLRAGLMSSRRGKQATEIEGVRQKGRVELATLKANLAKKRKSQAAALVNAKKQTLSESITNANMAAARQKVKNVAQTNPNVPQHELVKLEADTFNMLMNESRLDPKSAAMMRRNFQTVDQRVAEGRGLKDTRDYGKWKIKRGKIDAEMAALKKTAVSAPRSAWESVARALRISGAAKLPEVIATLRDPKERQLASNIQRFFSLDLKDISGAAVTAHEEARQQIANGLMAGGGASLLRNRIKIFMQAYDSEVAAAEQAFQGARQTQ